MYAVSGLWLQFAHGAAIRDRPAGLDVYVELDRLELRRADFDLMRTGFHVGLLHPAVEVVDRPDEISVDVNLGITLWQVDPVKLTVDFVADVPSRGDTCFPSMLPVALLRTSS